MAPISSAFSDGAMRTVAAQWFVIGFVCCLLPAIAASIAAVFFLKRRLKQDAEGGKDANGQAGKGGPTATRSDERVQQGSSKKPLGKDGRVVQAQGGKGKTPTPAESSQVFASPTFCGSLEPGTVYENGNGENPYDSLAGEDNAGESQAYMKLQVKG